MNPAGYYYHAFGLTLSSTIAIAEFSPCQPQQSCDVHISCQAAGSPPPEFASENHFFDVKKKSAFLYFSGVGQFVIADERTIIIIPDNQAAMRTVCLYLSGVVFAVLLYLRGFLVFHGSCLAVSETEAVAVIGDSGAGKSTLAAVLHCKGYKSIADDIVIVNVANNSIHVRPAFPLLKVSREVARLLGVDEQDLLEVECEEEKRYMVLPATSVQPSYILKAVFFLEVDKSTTISPLSARQIMMKSIRFTMPMRLLQQIGEQNHFMQCAAVANAVPGYTLTRTANFSSINATVNAVEKVIAENS